MTIRPFQVPDEAAVISLWERCDLTRPWNDPGKDIRRKSTVQPELFLVGIEDQTVVASAMAGYDGHRGWVNYLAVDPECRHRGLGREMMSEVEQRLLAIGCPKLNLQIRGSNTVAIEFYRQIGYAVDDVVSLGKRLEPDER